MVAGGALCITGICYGLLAVFAIIAPGWGMSGGTSGRAFGAVFFAAGMVVGGVLLRKRHAKPLLMCL
jgi:hypothetical protein